MKIIGLRQIKQLKLLLTLSAIPTFQNQIRPFLVVQRIVPQKAVPIPNNVNKLPKSY